MKRNIISLICLGFVVLAVSAQERELTSIEQLEQRTERLESAMRVLQGFRASGYFQTQYMWGEKDATVRVGAPNENPEEPFSRFGVRRGRFGLTFTQGLVFANFELDVIERGVSFRNAFMRIRDPFWGTSSLTSGVFYRPFGHEIGISSARRESPERSAIILDLFPGERDLGSALTLQAPKESSLHLLTLDAGLFVGNGINLETDSRMDFIGRLSAGETIGNVMLGGGVSYYNGSVFQGTENVYKMNGNRFELNNDPSNQGKYAKREYLGFDLQLNVASDLGLTKITSEYIFGQQPGTETSSRSPNSSSLPNRDTYIRNVSGGYVMLVQDFEKLPFSAVLKYDWYDPNTKVSGNEVGLGGTNETDLLRSAYGFGVLWHAMRNVRLTAYYEINNKETSDNILSTFKGDTFTLRLQYRF